ncbi:GIY-YIG nuclease family protein [Candidatus Peregrinibacteria bacterium]|nr:GIY-YIG nuclease family protein [Candidatus Peregrinibacteria bacterium]
MFIVYVLRSEKNGYRYIGQTNNLERRIREHNDGLTKSIQFQTPFRIEHTETFATRQEAIFRERFLKSGKGREWLCNNVASMR